MEPKKAWQSKTLWINFVLAALAIFFPPAKEFMEKNPEIVMGVVTGLNFILRLISKGKIELV